jgi:cytochrome c-type biogenesis protein CcmH
MTLFWICAAALVVAALVLLLRPLLWPRSVVAGTAAGLSNVHILRDQLAELDTELAAGQLTPEQHAGSRAELERRVLEEAGATEAVQNAAGGRSGALVIGLLLPLLAVGLYTQLGNRNAFDPILSKPVVQATEQDIEVLLDRMAKRLNDKPDDPDGWALLGRTYAAMERFEPARDAYARALKLQPENPNLLADLADTLAMTQGRKLAGEPERLVLAALKIDPDHLKALALAGSAAMERGDAKTAVLHWTRVQSLIPPDSPMATGLLASLNEARAAAGMPAVVAAVKPASVPTVAAAASAARVQVQVSLAPALKARLQPGDTLFVFARAAEGPRMPLAIARLNAVDLPLQVVLDDSQAMSPQMRLSAFDRVVIGARVSRTGNALPQAGDLEGQSEPLSHAAGKPVSIVIDRARE